MIDLFAPMETLEAKPCMTSNDKLSLRCIVRGREDEGQGISKGGQLLSGHSTFDLLPSSSFYSVLKRLAHTI